MAHAAQQFAASVRQRTEPADRAAQEAAHVAAQAAKYQSAKDSAVTQYQGRTA